MQVISRAKVLARTPLLGIAMLAAGLMSGCAEMARWQEMATPAPAPRPAPVAVRPPVNDPLAAFAASAAPGAQASMPGGGSVRLARAYTAASGRECRELLLGQGVEERGATYCREEQGWVAARPLLRGGTARP